jgi:cytochrome P450
MSDFERPPGPEGHWLMGNLPELKQDELRFMRKYASEYGDVVRFRFVHRTAYMYTNPYDVHQILVDKSSKFQKAPLYRLVLGRFLGDGLLTSEGDFWKRQRKLAQPAFHHGRIQDYADVMVGYATRLVDEWQDGVVRDINRDMMRLTLNIVAKTLFDVEMDSNADRFYQAMSTLLHTSEQAFNSPRFTLTPNWFPWAHNFQIWGAVRELDAIVGAIIDERRQSDEDRGDLLSMLLLAEDEAGQRMSDKQLRDEAVTIVAAGHETTANALAWTWYLLAQHPEIEARLHDELDRVLQGRAPTMADLPQLEYATMIIKESMRLYPPAPGFARQSLEDVEIGPYLHPKETIAMIPAHILHRDERWHPEPSRFMPERFSKENEPNMMKYSYLPFGGGPRICIGNSFAMMEAALLLATMAQRFKLRLEPGQNVVPEMSVTLRPRENMRMRLEARQPVRVAARELVEA